MSTRLLISNTFIQLEFNEHLPVSGFFYSGETTVNTKKSLDLYVYGEKKGAKFDF